jgi:hypothetical protein
MAEISEAPTNRQQPCIVVVVVVIVVVGAQFQAGLLITWAKIPVHSLSGEEVEVCVA